MRQAYQEQLADLGDHGAHMCRMAGDAVRDAGRALLDTDLAAAERAIAMDVPLDEMRAQAEDSALQLLALQAPVASDLRAVVSALWVVADLQRMGALAIHIAKAARRRHPNPVVPEPVRGVFEQMSEVAENLCDRAEQVLRTRDLQLAAGMDAADDRMDNLHRDMFAALMSPDWPHEVSTAVDLALLGRFFERFADHAVSVARRVMFLVTGENVGGDTSVVGSPAT